MERQDLLLLPATNVLTYLHSSEEGLRQSEADAHRVTYGPNVLKKSKNTALRIFGRQLKSSLIYLLMFASALCFFLKDISDGVIIAVILLINTCLGFFQEYKSERAVETLSTLIRKRVLVKRDRKPLLLDEALLVPLHKRDSIHLFCPTISTKVRI